jgi:hypothetical protein
VVWSVSESDSDLKSCDNVDLFFQIDRVFFRGAGADVGGKGAFTTLTVGEDKNWSMSIQ